jgi:arginyl-tRNA synthetase
MSVDIKGLVARGLHRALSSAGQAHAGEKELRDLIEVPPQKEFGDYAVPCFRFAKNMRKNPAQAALDFEQAIAAGCGHSGTGVGAAESGGTSGRGGAVGDSVSGLGIIRSAKARGPYLNVFLDKSYVVSSVIEDYAKTGFGTLSRRGQGRTAVVDFSSPNIAKPFGIGHLRSTVIGNSLCKIYSALGYRVVGINHLGDWGTQFGKLITAYKRWGKDGGLDKDPIKYLFQLYVRFHAEAETNPELENEARTWFSRLEGGDAEATRLWKRFRDLSIEEFQKIYRRLGVTFDHFTGESFYGEMLNRTVQEVVNRGVTEESEGALVVQLEGLPPALIKKRDDATLYMTRDIAAALYRHDTFHFDIALYVVGSPQTLHFRQLFGVLAKMGVDWVDRCHHVPFGQIGFVDGAMSTRKGNVVFLEDVLDRAVELARGVIEEKNPELRGKNDVAEAVGVGAIIFNDLKNSRIKDITFDWDEILNFNGETGPYLQYTYARITSLLKNFREAHGDLVFPEEGEMRGDGKSSGIPAGGEFRFGDEGYDLALLANAFEEAVLRAAQEFEPSIISRILLELASSFNAFYNKHRVVTEDRKLSLARALVVAAVRSALGKGLELLGIKALEEM